MSSLSALLIALLTAGGVTPAIFATSSVFAGKNNRFVWKGTQFNKKAGVHIPRTAVFKVDTAAFAYEQRIACEELPVHEIAAAVGGVPGCVHRPDLSATQTNPLSVLKRYVDFERRDAVGDNLSAGSRGKMLRFLDVIEMMVSQEHISVHMRHRS